jgi:hypothetical protein
MESTNPQNISGDWIGFYNYGNSQVRHSMELNISVIGELLSGRGMDDVAGFTISGALYGDECSWTKVYDGQYDTVDYIGFVEAERIWGTWAIDMRARGGFLIRPRKGNSPSVASEVPKAIERVAPSFVGVER